MNIALFKMKIKLFKVELHLRYFTWQLILDHNYAFENLKTMGPQVKKVIFAQPSYIGITSIEMVKSKE